MSHFGKAHFDVEANIPDFSRKVILVSGGGIDQASNTILLLTI